jgi:hypothetical protein
MEPVTTANYFEMSFSLPNIALETCFYTLLHSIEIVDASEGYALFRTSDQVAYTILMSSIGSVFVKKVVLTPETACEVDVISLSLPTPQKRTKKDTGNSN